jgi:hypothetical protein
MPGPATGPRILVAAPGDDVPPEVVDDFVNAVEEIWPRAQVSLLGEDGPWEGPAWQKWEWIAGMQRGEFDQAIIIGDGTYSPYPLAYVLYLAGVPLRSGVTTEFGGKLLTRRLDPPGPGRYPAPNDLIERDIELEREKGYG